jgi:hypothetical protein
VKDSSKSETGIRGFGHAGQDNLKSIGAFHHCDADTGMSGQSNPGEWEEKFSLPAVAWTACINQPARPKRIYNVSEKAADAEGVVRAITDAGSMRQGHTIFSSQSLGTIAGRIQQTGRMGIPFITIEDVDVVDACCIAMGFDKSLPCTSGRGLDKRDDILFILRRVPDFPQSKLFPPTAPAAAFFHARKAAPERSPLVPSRITVQQDMCRGTTRPPLSGGDTACGASHLEDVQQEYQSGQDHRGSYDECIEKRPQ